MDIYKKRVSQELWKLILRQWRISSTAFLLAMDNTLTIYEAMYRSSRPEVCYTKCTGKHLCQSLFLRKLQASGRPATLLKRFWHRCFSVNFVKLLRTLFYIEHLWWLLLYIQEYLQSNKQISK